MAFENLVVSVAGPDGLPTLTNAGEERFQGFETSLTWSPRSVPSLSLVAGYAHHDATYARFSFADPDGNLVIADGNRLELVPRDAWNVRFGYAPKTGLGVWAAVRHQGVRPLDPENTASVPAFFEWDAGISWENRRLRLSFVGRNLGDDRRFVTESEIGDSQFYVAPPRRFVGEIAFRF
jgi:outer membrane receptor protein involved in Fe transport